MKHASAPPPPVPALTGLDADRLAGVLKALAHPARLTILRTLAARGSCVCGEVVDVLPLAQATVSQHLKVLREAGLITGETDGPRSCYCLNASAVRGLRATLTGLLDLLEHGAPASAPGCC